MSCPVRTYPLRKPPGHVPPIPRWQLQLPPDAARVFTAYIGVQCTQSSGAAHAAFTSACAAVQAWLDHDADGPPAIERFVVLDGDDVQGSAVWVAYWTDADAYEQCVSRLALADWHAALGEAGRAVGLWCERFATAVSRLETNYSGLDYLPGLARLPGATTVEHSLSAYWGAARDRIPDAAHDRFETTGDEAARPASLPAGLGERWMGSNYQHMIHIRSGQYWAACGPVEGAAYETQLKPVLETGLAHLWAHAGQTGTLALRYLCNLAGDGTPLKETCGAGFFRSLGDLEHWAEHHPSHLAIFHGAIAHAQSYGESRRLRTWHEVTVLKRGEAVFDYVNCAPRTGVLQAVALVRTPLR